jgi:hypothetical protein
MWLQHFGSMACGHLQFPSHHQMAIEMFPNVVDKTKENCVIPTLASCITCTCSFDLWMSHVNFDTFDIIVSFINASWVPCHVTIEIFEVNNVTGVAMENQVKSLLDSFDLLDKVIAYIKDEGLI